MAMLKYVKREAHPSPSILSRETSKLLSSKFLMLSAWQQRSPSTADSIIHTQKEQRAMIGKYAAENGPTNAAKHYTAVWGIEINKVYSKEKCLKKLKEEILEQHKKWQVTESKAASDGEDHKEEPIVSTELKAKPRGRPILLGEQRSS